MNELELDVTVNNGKYTVQQTKDGAVTCLRHGEPWRDCVGDNLILSLAQEVERLTALVHYPRRAPKQYKNGKECTHKKIYEAADYEHYEDEFNKDHLVYSYNGSGYFWTCDDFSYKYCRFK